MSFVLSKHQCCSSALSRQAPAPTPPPLMPLSALPFIPSKTSKQHSASDGEQREPFLQARADGKKDETWWRRRGFISSQAGVLIWDYYGTSGSVKQIEIKAGERVLTHACTFTPSLKNKKNGQKCSWMEFMNSQSHAALQRPFLWRQGHPASARSRGVFFSAEIFALQKNR